MSLLTLENITLSYCRVQVLHDISIPAISAGELVGLLGPNAAGKSSLISAVASLGYTSGTVRLEGRSAKDVGKAKWLEAIGYMPQTPPQPSGLRPYELLVSTAKALGLALDEAALHDRITAIFTELGLTSDAMNPLASLSGGKRQLVGLAMVLVRSPKVLMLDEPTSALDLRWRMIVLEKIRETIASRNSAGIIALHDMDLAARYCDRLVLLDHGRVIADGPPGEVITPTTLANVYGVEARIGSSDNGKPTVEIMRPVHDDLPQA